MGALVGRVACVTGGSRGIGKAIVSLFLSEGATVWVLDKDESSLEVVKKEYSEENNRLFTRIVDICNRSEIERVYKEVLLTGNRIDILVNNAGIIRDNLLFKMSEDDWDSVISVHLKGAFICSQIFQEQMVKQTYGRIINISSTSALGNKGQANYSTAKAGIQGFTKTLALELGKYNITVNAIAPGFIETEMTKQTASRLGIDFRELIDKKRSAIPVGRTGKPEDIANAALFFAQDTSSFVSGQVLYVAGGPKN
ncbi:SDR family NAD(P)-dependent oxidoreductase [Alkalihalophilus sp. As8PL]|uniref:SDR family NAD(P)-dependent oxidoreductase n=1 Tax=Alkalihalophilus sp. As8PL TaxID=3237103 RepID=A0AB39BXF8_9BACI